MTTFWIVVADAGRALVWSKIVGTAAPTIVHQLENPVGRLHTSEIASDQPGRVQKKGGHVQSAMDPRTDPHEQKAIVFARELCGLLDAAADRHAFDSLILIAPGHFLGLINSTLGQVATKRLAMSQAKDLTHAGRDDLHRYINELVHLPGIVTNV